MGPLLVPLKYRMVGKDALIVVSDDGRYQPVQVTRDALTDIQSPPRCDAVRLGQYIEVFVDIAKRKIETGEIAFDGRVWITGNDVRAWRHRIAERGRSSDAP